MPQVHKRELNRCVGFIHLIKALLKVPLQLAKKRSFLLMNDHQYTPSWYWPAHSLTWGRGILFSWFLRWTPEEKVGDFLKISTNILVGAAQLKMHGPNFCPSPALALKEEFMVKVINLEIRSKKTKNLWTGTFGQKPYVKLAAPAVQSPGHSGACNCRFECRGWSFPGLVQKRNHFPVHAVSQKPHVVILIWSLRNIGSCQYQYQDILLKTSPNLERKSNSFSGSLHLYKSKTFTELCTRKHLLDSDPV